MELRKLTKRGAIELSVGTVVIIVLAMSMLILGIVLIRNIFSGATESVRNIDTGVKSEINKLFSENQDRKLVLFPDSGIVKLKQGSQDEGFAISIRNTDVNNHIYSYRVSLEEQGNCPTGLTNDLSSGFAQIITGGEINNLELPRSTAMEEPRKVRLGISDTAPACTFSLKVEVSQEGSIYQTDFMEVEIIPK